MTDYEQSNFVAQQSMEFFDELSSLVHKYGLRASLGGLHEFLSCQAEAMFDSEQVVDGDLFTDVDESLLALIAYYYA